MSARCKGCDAEIIWATWEASGKAIPLDAQPDAAKGSLALVKGEVHRHNGLDDRLGRDKYVPHFQTCPRASDFRKER